MELLMLLRYSHMPNTIISSHSVPITRDVQRKSNVSRKTNFTSFCDHYTVLHASHLTESLTVSMVTKEHSKYPSLHRSSALTSFPSAFVGDHVFHPYAIFFNAVVLER